MFGLCVLSGFAGVLTELLLKDRSVPSSLWVRNLQMSAFSLPIAISAVVITDGRRIWHSGFWVGCDGWLLATVSLGALGGILTSIALKYADALLKSFAVGCSIALSAALSSTLITALPPPPAHALHGAVVVVAATAVYHRAGSGGGSGGGGGGGGGQHGAPSSDQQGACTPLITAGAAKYHRIPPFSAHADAECAVGCGAESASDLAAEIVVESAASAVARDHDHHHHRHRHHLHGDGHGHDDDDDDGDDDEIAILAANPVLERERAPLCWPNERTKHSRNGAS
eukprot:475986-Pleurochrysis_carterae.AAC.2